MSSKGSQLFNAACRDNANIVSSILREATGHEVNSLHTKYSFASRHEWTPLIAAAESGYILTVRALLRDPRVNVNAVDDSGCTALIWASHNGHSATVYALLGSEYIDVNIQSTHGNTALMVATANGHIEIVKMLLEHHDINITIRNNNFGPDGDLFPQSAADMAQSVYIRDLINNHAFPRAALAVRVLPDEAAAAIVVHPVSVDINTELTNTGADSGTTFSASHQYAAEAVVATLAAPIPHTPHSQHAQHTDEQYAALEARNVRLVAQITVLQQALDVKDNKIEALQRQVTQLLQQQR